MSGFGISLLMVGWMRFTSEVCSSAKVNYKKKKEGQFEVKLQYDFVKKTELHQSLGRLAAWCSSELSS